MPALWKSAIPSVAFGSIFLTRIAHSALEKPCYARLSHIFHEARQRYIHMKNTFILKTIRGGRDINKNAAKPPLLERTGWCWSREAFL